MKLQSTRLFYLLPGILALILNGCATADKEKPGPQAAAVQNTAVAEQAYRQGLASYKKGDYAAAVQQFQQAADQGYAKAQYNLGLAYLQGQGVAKNDQEGINWFRKAAEQNFAPAQYNVGIAYVQGLGVQKDPRQGVEWFQKAAKQGFDPAQYKLGTSLYQGQGIAKDPVMAYVWLSLAAAQGNKDAQIAQKRVGKALSPMQKAQAQQLIPDYSRQYGRPAQA
ncbi:MAG: tetratricopeptide repeat protein [Candidatus Competibacteraceae bacterium]